MEQKIVLGELRAQLQALQVRPLGGMLSNLGDDITAVEQTMRSHSINTLVLPVGVVLAEAEGDMCSWELNLTALPRKTLYQLQDGVTTEPHAMEGRAFQILTEHKENLEQVSLQCDDLGVYNQELEQAMTEACIKVTELVVPVELLIIDKIHHMVAGFCTAGEEAAKAQWELNL